MQLKKRKSVHVPRLLLFVLLFLLSSCSDGKLNFFSVEDDINMGKTVTSEVLADPVQYPLLQEFRYKKSYQYVRSIRNRILESSAFEHASVFDWDIYLVHNDSVLNAFCTPGGYIFIYTGLLKTLDSEDELAGVMGHEMAHADLRHSSNQMSKNYGIRLALRLLVGDNGLLGSLTAGLAGLSFSRKDESEADLKSVQYLLDAGYDPMGAAHFFEKMEKRKDIAQPPQILSTHPHPDNRIKAIRDKWVRLGSKKVKTNGDGYTQFVKSLPD